MVLLSLPSLLRYFEIASSMALGTTLAAATILLFGNRSGALAAIRHQTRGRHLTTKITLRVLFLVAAHFSIASIVLPTEAMRAVTSLVPLALFIAGAAIAAHHVQGLPGSELHISLNHCFVIMCGIAALGVVGWAPASPQALSKPVFPFSEPSHFAIAFAPLLMFVCVTSAGVKRVCALLVGLAITMLLENLTLAVGCGLVAVVSLKPRMIVLLGGLLALAATQLDISYFASRLDFGADNQNLSTLVYLQGWQVMEESWRQSGGFGLGFQQLGTQGSAVDAAEIIYSIMGDYLNLLDGGFNLSKLVSEFGVFGVALCIVYLVTAWRAARQLRLASAAALGRQNSSPALVFAHCVVVAYVVEMFVRGNGYFSPTSFLLVCGFWVMYERGRTARLVSRRSLLQSHSSLRAH